MSTTPSLTSLFSDPNFLALIAGIGTEMDPTGPGGIIGRPTQALIKAKAAQKAGQTTLHKNPPGMVSDVSEDTPLTPTPTTTAPKLSYAPVDPTARSNEIQDLLTPPGTEGLTSIARDKSGEVNVKLTPRKPAVPANDMQASLQGDIDTTLDPYLRRRSARQETNLIATGAGEGEGVAERHNNPLNIKQGKATQGLVDSGVATKGEAARDGGNFLRFKNPQDGLRAAEKLLTSPLYNSLSIDAALRKWSNNGYGGDVAKAAGIDPALRVRDLSPDQITKLTSAMAAAESGTSVPSAQQADIDSTLGTAPSTQRAQEPTTEVSNLPEEITLDIVKDSPDAPAKRAVAPSPLVSAIPQYDLRGLNPAEVNAVVGRALEARQIEATSAAAGTQLVESEDGYVVVNRRTGTVVPLTKDGKVDPVRTQALAQQSRLTPFAQEMSEVPGTSATLRGKMNESQAKNFKFGSRALQANEYQRQLEQRVSPDKLADYNTTVLGILEALPPETPASSLFGLPVGAIATGVGNVVTGGWDWVKQQITEAKEYVTKDKTMTAEQKRERTAELDKALENKVLDPRTLLGLGPAAARVQAILNIRAKLTPEQREVMQNQLEFATAVLRDESGAAVSVGEFLSTSRQYFPQMGDTRRDVLRKMRSRQQTIRGLRTSAGRPLLPPDIGED